MLFKVLWDAWHSTKVMSRLHDELLQMVAATEGMFKTVGNVLFEGDDPAPLRNDLYDTDRAVNKAERRIRKEIVEHLALNPAGDTPACLVLMSLVKDAERVGDQCKNLFEVRELHESSFADDDQTRRMRAAYDETLETFSRALKTLREADEDMARTIMDGEKEFSRVIEEMVREVAASDLPTREAVSRVLCLRHTKRVHAHLCNLVSSVIQPVHKIDYAKKKKLPKVEEPAEGDGQ